MADYLPKFSPGTSFTINVTGTITGGDLVSATGATAGPGSLTVIGVASRDAVAGDQITLYRGGIQQLRATATITAGATLKAGSGGSVVPFVEGTDTPSMVVGRALVAAASGSTVTVALINV